MKYNKNDLSKNLLEKCMQCHHGGKNIFPNCLDFDPTKDCYYFDDINDDNPCDEDYDCEAYMHQNTYKELHKLLK